MKRYNKFFSSLLILSLFLSMFPVGASAATTETKTETVPIKFLASQRFNPSSTLKDISVNLNVPDGYKAKSYQIWKMVSDSNNNVKLSNQGTMNSQISGDQLTIPSFAGAKVTVEKPGYISTMNYKINRRSNGKEWIVQGNGVGPYYVTPQASDPCWQGGITVCVGFLNKDNSGNSISSKLKTNEGWATETSGTLPSPSIFDYKNESIYKTALILSSVKIIKADPMTTFHKVLSTSNGDEPGTGKLTVATKLTRDNTIGEMKGCTGCSGLAGEMNYLMESLTFWEAQTYLYEGEVRVTYEKLPPKDKPLVECSCTVDPSTVQFADKDISATSTLTATVKQKGSLAVKEWKLYGRLNDQSQLQTQTYSQTDSINHKFSFTIPKSKLDNVDSYTEIFVMRAVVYFKDGTSAEQAIECTTTITKPGVATPSPSPGATPEPTPKPPNAVEAKIRFDPPQIFTGDKSTLLNNSENVESFEWEFSANLDPMVTNKEAFDIGEMTYPDKGLYEAKIVVTGKDGQTDTDTTYLHVSDPKPVAVVAGVPRAIQGRPLVVPYNLDNSFTPLASRGVTIDHTKDEQRYKKVGNTDYLAGFPLKNAPNELGEYSIEGKVYDSQGRVSEWDAMILTVVPDEPPVVELVVQPEGYRGVDTTIFVQAASVDGDKLVGMVVEERFDDNYDGNFDDEAWETIYSGDYKSEFPKVYTSVGKRQYRATVTEDYGLSGSSNIDEIDIINQQPTVDFDPKGIIQQPGQGEDSGPPITKYTPESIFRSWSLKAPYLGGDENKLGWKTNANTISTKNAKDAEYKTNYPNLGDGPNARSLYTLTDDPVSLPTWTFNTNLGGGNFQGLEPNIFSKNRMVSHFTNTTMIGGTYRQTVTFNILNAKTGSVINSFTTPLNLNNDMKLVKVGGPDESVYLLGGNQLHVYNLDGQKTKDITFDVNVNNAYTSTVNFSEDGKYMYVVSSESFMAEDRFDVYVEKYSLDQQVRLWKVKLANYARYGILGNKTDIIARDDGSLYVGYQYSYFTPNGTSARGVSFGYINSNGIVQYHQRFGYGSLSAPVVSDDGKYVYLNTWQTDEYAEWDGTYIVDLNTNTAISKLGSRSLTDEWKTRNNQFVQNPIVLPDSNVANSYVLLNKYGNQIGSLGVGISGKIPRRPVLQSNGKILTVGVENSTKKQFVIQNDYASPVYVDHAMPNSNGSTNSTTSNITPDGEIFVFSAFGGNSNMMADSGDNYLDNTNSPIYVTPIVPRTAIGGGVIGEVDANTIIVKNKTWGGLLYDPYSKMKNQILEFQTVINHLTDNDGIIGAAIRVQDEKNMYSVEWTKDTLTLFKVVNGTKSKLKETSLTRSLFQMYNFKIDAMDSDLSVSVNGNKLLEASDSKFANGSAGIMSLGQQQASFGKVVRTNYGDSYPEVIYNAVLINDPIQYDKLFGDPEYDPMGSESWTYEHDPSYFANPLGLSVHDGKTYTTALNSLEKPGLYDITYFAYDNPGASSYAKAAAAVTKPIYVHRRPVALPNVIFTGIVYPDGEVLDYLTNDTSYDPDIPDRLADRLFRTRWSDESTWTTGERTLYNRPGVELIIQEQVKDLYGAWSFWEEVRVFKEKLPPVNQTKPRMIITVPDGTLAKPTVLITDPNVYWIYQDDENDPQEQYRLNFTYVDDSSSAFKLQGIGNDLNYEVPEGSIDPGRVVKIQGQVFSKGVWSDDSNIVYFVIDMPPLTYLLSFNGPKASQPIYTNNNRPELRVFTVDPENDPIKYIDYEVFFNATGNQVIDTNTATAAANLKPSTPLQEGLHHWRARANDSYLWGPYSETGYFFVDTVRPDDVDEQLEIKPTSVTVKWNAFSDTPPSSGHATRTFYMQKVNADRSITNIDLNSDGSAEYSIPVSNSTRSHTVNGLIPGQEYRLTVIDYDVAGNMGHYEYIYFLTNRPPEPNFDWKVKPIWEGDHIYFINTSTDPDGDAISESAWTIVQVETGERVTSTEFEPIIRFAKPGTYRVTLNVADSFGLWGDPITKDVEVLPISITGMVNHTDTWEKNRLKYNAAAVKAGRSERPSWYFFPGERFMLRADTIGPHITQVDSYMLDSNMASTSYSANLPGSPDIWNGSLWSKEMIGWDDQDLYFKFILTTDTGYTKESELVKVRIVDDEYWRQHTIR